MKKLLVYLFVLTVLFINMQGTAKAEIASRIGEEGVFVGDNLNDWCTTARLSIWKSGYSLTDTPKMIAISLSESNYFSDEFQKQQWIEDTASKILGKLKACDQFSDIVMLEVGYTYRKNDFDFARNILSVQLDKELAKYKRYSDFIANNRSVIHYSWEAPEDTEPAVGQKIVFNITKNGLNPRIADFYKIGPSVDNLYNELGVPGAAW